MQATQQAETVATDESARVIKPELTLDAAKLSATAAVKGRGRGLVIGRVAGGRPSLTDEPATPTTVLPPSPPIIQSTISSMPAAQPEAVAQELE